MTEKYNLRTATLDDHPHIDQLLEAAFESMEEVHLIHALRDSGEMMQEHVMEIEGQIAGYGAVSAMVAPLGWLCLAPVAVAPAFQGLGYGVRIVAKIAKVANTIGPEIVVLGDPAFYEAAGFSTARAAMLSSPYPVEYTSLAGPGDDAPNETLIYPDAFSKLS